MELRGSLIESGCYSTNPIQGMKQHQAGFGFSGYGAVLLKQNHLPRLTAPGFTLLQPQGDCLLGRSHPTLQEAMFAV